VRTPLLKQVVIGTSKTPKEAQGEARTAGNALGQSWGLLNSRASNEFMTKVRASKYAKDIRLMAQIHDSQYFLVRDNPDLLEYMNVHLVKAVQWQEAKEIQHPTVKLGGDLSIFYPSWADEITIPNGLNQKEILTVCIDEANKRKEQ
jgi:DNA polymerase-1